ncbi:MAG TPA: Rrf2 family transcriptional regulator [Stellaceae bacterium]|nr:Rrf2 family transcriptional regulator [Stellaceae bacterium]
MSRATRFSIAVHMLALIESPGECRLSSVDIAASVGTNASFVRRVLSMLAKAKLIHSAAGITGATLARPPEKIMLLDVYRAVGLEGGHRPAIHDNTNPGCPIGRRIGHALATMLDAAESAFEKELAGRSLADVLELIHA